MTDSLAPRLSPTTDAAPHHQVPRSLVLLFAAACGLIVANLYYAQPLIGLIAPDVGLGTATASLIVTLTQLGYCLGLVLLVPLGDLLENRRLVLVTLAGTVLSLVIAAGVGSALPFLAAAWGVGVSSVVVQMLVPMAAHLAPDAVRGRVVGNVMSGLLIGIMLARPVASLVAGAVGWRAVFAGSAALMVALGVVLRQFLPTRRPAADHRYTELIGSLWQLWRETPALRRRAFYQAALFAAFSLYWTAVPLLLTSPAYGLTQRGVAWFTLAGVAGAFAAPVAGRLADRGLTHRATGIALAVVALSFVLAALGSHGSLGTLLAAGVLLDLGVQANLVLGQRTIYALRPEVRSRLNGLYMATFFAGGAVGSGVASVAFAHGGWQGVSWVGTGFALAALAYYATEKRDA